MDRITIVTDKYTFDKLLNYLHGFCWNLYNPHEYFDWSSRGLSDRVNSHVIYQGNKVNM